MQWQFFLLSSEHFIHLAERSASQCNRERRKEAGEESENKFSFDRELEARRRLVDSWKVFSRREMQ